MIEDSVIHVKALYYSHDCLKFGLWISFYLSKNVYIFCHLARDTKEHFHSGLISVSLLTCERHSLHFVLKN